MSRHLVVVLLALLLGLQAVTTDLYLPALPAIRESLNASMGEIQLTLTALLLAFGVGVLGMGVVYGVPIMVVGAAIVLLSSYGWVLEPSVAEPIDFEPPSADGSTKEIAPLG
mgnify:CR=1 FL=1